MARLDSLSRDEGPQLPSPSPRLTQSYFGDEKLAGSLPPTYPIGDDVSSPLLGTASGQQGLEHDMPPPYTTSYYDVWSTMSSAPPPVFQTLPTKKSSYNLPAVLDAALIAYKKRTRQNLTAHPLTTQLQACDSPEAILIILQSYAKQFGSPQSDDERLNTWFSPVVNVLYIFYARLDEGVGSVNINSFVVRSERSDVDPAESLTCQDGRRQCWYLLLGG